MRFATLHFPFSNCRSLLSKSLFQVFFDLLDSKYLKTATIKIASLLEVFEQS